MTQDPKLEETAVKLNEATKAAARYKELVVAARALVQADDLVNQAIADGLNVHGAMAGALGATDNLLAAARQYEGSQGGPA